MAGLGLFSRGAASSDALEDLLAHPYSCSLRKHQVLALPSTIQPDSTFFSNHAAKCLLRFPKDFRDHGLHILAQADEHASFFL